MVVAESSSTTHFPSAFRGLPERCSTLAYSTCVQKGIINSIQICTAVKVSLYSGLASLLGVDLLKVWL